MYKEQETIYREEVVGVRRRGRPRREVCGEMGLELEFVDRDDWKLTAFANEAQSVTYEGVLMPWSCRGSGASFVVVGHLGIIQ